MSPRRDGVDRINILLVDDQRAKLLSYEAILGELGENLIMASSAREALEHLLKVDVAVVLMDVCMPETDGFELAEIIREHPRFQQTAIIFVSAIHLSDLDRLRGYQAGAVDYVPVPVVPEVLRAKVRVFAELHRKTRQLEALNNDLERRVEERTAALEASTAQLRQSEQRRSLALAAGRMGSWDWDLATDTYNWDAGQYAIFGFASDRFVPDGPTVLSLIHPDDRAQVYRANVQAIKTGQPFHLEFRVVRPNGEIRWCVIGGAPSVVDRDGAIARVSGVTQDITDGKQAEEALLQVNEELERRIEERTREREVALAQLFEAQKLETIGHLTGGVAHDFNNLLTAVLGSLELLRKRPTNDLRSTRLLDNAIQGAQRGAALTQRLLAFARRQDLKPEAVQLARLVSGIEPLLERALGAGIRLETEIASDLPSVHADSNQLELALLNLAVNSRDAMPLGGRIRISATAVDLKPDGNRDLTPGNYVCISVADTGIGMDEATLSKASEPFFTTKGPGKGTGLGLSMVHGLAAQSGGQLKLSSKIGAGTTVELYLPQAETDAPAVDAPGPLDTGAIGGTRSTTILIVDDDTLVCTSTAAMIEDLGHRVIEANSGAQALEILRETHEIDLLITDHLMPEMTGTELAAQVRQLYPGLRILLATGYAELPAGAESNLPRLAKPFRIAQLATAIAQLAAPPEQASRPRMSSSFTTSLAS